MVITQQEAEERKFSDRLRADILVAQVNVIQHPRSAPPPPLVKIVARVQAAALRICHQVGDGQPAQKGLWQQASRVQGMDHPFQVAHSAHKHRPQQPKPGRRARFPSVGQHQVNHQPVSRAQGQGKQQRVIQVEAYPRGGARQARDQRHHHVAEVVV